MERVIELSQLQDKDGNTVIGDVKLLASENTYVSEDKLVAAIGINDLVIVSTKDAVLVALKNAAQDVKQITQALQTNRAVSGSFTARFIDLG